MEWTCGPECPFYMEIDAGWGPPREVKCTCFGVFNLSVHTPHMYAECLWSMEKWEEEAEQLAHQLSQFNRAIAARKEAEQA